MSDKRHGNAPAKLLAMDDRQAFIPLLNHWRRGALFQPQPTVYAMPCAASLALILTQKLVQQLFKRRKAFPALCLCRCSDPTAQQSASRPCLTQYPHVRSSLKCSIFTKQRACHHPEWRSPLPCVKRNHWRRQKNGAERQKSGAVF